MSIKGSNEIRVFSLDADDRPSKGATLNSSAGTTPFGFTFDRRGNLLVVEAFGRNPVGTGNAGGSGTISVHRINQGSGSLTFIQEIGGLPAEDGAVGIAAR